MQLLSRQRKRNTKRIIKRRASCVVCFFLSLCYNGEYRHLCVVLRFRWVQQVFCYRSGVFCDKVLLLIQCSVCCPLVLQTTVVIVSYLVVLRDVARSVVLVKKKVVQLLFFFFLLNKNIFFSQVKSRFSTIFIHLHNIFLVFT